MHMEPLPLSLTVTAARSQFKKLLGQNNHYLITILIGLNGVEAGTALLPDDFATSWNPRDVRRSVQRSREFAIKALLAWASDSLDAYQSALIPLPVPSFAQSTRWPSPTPTVSARDLAF
jgi:hypothetical protein